MAKALYKGGITLSSKSHEVDDSLIVMDNEYEHIKALEQ